jgi:tetratricopeptide (TPR) repeat protein
MRRALAAVFAAVTMVALPAFAQTQRLQTLQNAAALIQAGQLSSAEDQLQPVLRRNPDDAVALNLLGLIRLRQEKTDEAADLFRRAIAAGHNIPGPHVNLAMIYGTDQPGKAISELQQALAIAPDDKQAISLLRSVAKQASQAAMQRGDQKGANDVLASARSVLPQDPELLYDSGFVAYACGSYPEADQWLSQALKLRPDYPEASYAIARTYLAENLAKPAEEQMRRYLTEKPDDASAEYGLGYILMAEQKLGEAKAAFEKSLVLQPEQTESVYQLGEIASEQGQIDAARHEYSKVVAHDPRHAGALTGLGVLAYRDAKYEEAKADLERAIAAAPTYQKAHYYYALTLSRLGRKSDAEREFETAKKLQKPHGGEHHLMAEQP